MAHRPAPGPDRNYPGQCLASTHDRPRGTVRCHRYRRDHRVVVADPSANQWSQPQDDVSGSQTSHGVDFGP